MASPIDESAEVTTKTPSFPTSNTGKSADETTRIPIPATEHAPSGYITADTIRGTIFWEREPDEDTDRSSTTEPAAEPTSTADTADADTEQHTLGHPFQIEWLSTQRLPFFRARGLRNAWNQNREVKIARDGTEIEPSVGKKLVDMFHNPALGDGSSSTHSGEERQGRGGGAGRGGRERSDNWGRFQARGQHQPPHQPNLGGMYPPSAYPMDPRYGHGHGPGHRY
jgi:hypothetical protein